MQPRFARVLVVSAALLVPALALAWTQEQPFAARVHKHEFSRVLLSGGEGCIVKARLFFDAPAEGYASDTASRNFYRFHARIKLDSEHVLLTGIFHSQKPGSQVFDYQEDTTAHGCWAKRESHPFGVDVEGCRGRGCTPAPFK